MARQAKAEKASEAFRTISEVADALAVPQHVLRFWESKFNQIKPMKRAGGRRFYRPPDVDLLRGIQYLLHTQGYTIKGVQKLMREIGVRAVSDAGSELGAGRDVDKFHAVAESGGGGDGGQGQLELSGLSPSQRAVLSKSVRELVKLRDQLQSADKD